MEQEGSADVQEATAGALWALSADNAPNKATIAKLGDMLALLVCAVRGPELVRSRDGKIDLDLDLELVVIG